MAELAGAHAALARLGNGETTTGGVREGQNAGKRVVVVGGGIVGSATAYSLAVRGHRVTLVDEAPALAPQSRCSFGNAVRISIVMAGRITCLPDGGERAGMAVCIVLGAVATVALGVDLVRGRQASSPNQPTTEHESRARARPIRRI